MSDYTGRSIRTIIIVFIDACRSPGIDRSIARDERDQSVYKDQSIKVRTDELCVIESSCPVRTSMGKEHRQLIQRPTWLVGISHGAYEGHNSDYNSLYRVPAVLGSEWHV